MSLAYLADSANPAMVVVPIIGTLVLAAAGLTLFIIGLRSRSAGPRPAPPAYPPGYPPAAGHPQGFPAYSPHGYPPYPPVPPLPARKAGTGPLISGIVLFVVGLLGFVSTVAIAVGVGGNSRLAIGDCYTNEILDKSQWTSLSCKDPDAVLEYAAKSDPSGNCPDGKLNNSSYLSIDRDGARRCFIPNLIESHCYASERNDESVRRVSCATAGRVIRVVKRLDGTTDSSGCPTDSRAVSFPQPKRTYCTERTGAGIT